MKTFGRPPAITSTLNFPPPTIFKDELLAGYRGRIALMNGLQSEKKVAQFLSAIHCGGYSQPHHTAAFIEGAAFVNSLGVDDLLHAQAADADLAGFHARAFAACEQCTAQQGAEQGFVDALHAGHLLAL